MLGHAHRHILTPTGTAAGIAGCIESLADDARWSGQGHVEVKPTAVDRGIIGAHIRNARPRPTPQVGGKRVCWRVKQKAIDSRAIGARRNGRRREVVLLVGREVAISRGIVVTRTKEERSQPIVADLTIDPWPTDCSPHGKEIGIHHLVRALGGWLCFRCLAGVGWSGRQVDRDRRILRFGAQGIDHTGIAAAGYADGARASGRRCRKSQGCQDRSPELSPMTSQATQAVLLSPSHHFPGVGWVSSPMATFSAHTASPPPLSRAPAGSRASSRHTSLAPRTASARGPLAWDAPRARTHRSIPTPNPNSANASGSFTPSFTPPTRARESLRPQRGAVERNCACMLLCTGSCVL